VPKSRVRVVRGPTARSKLLEIDAEAALVLATFGVPPGTSDAGG